MMMMINVNIGGIRLQQVNKCKHLGLVVDQTMTWCDQVDTIKKKVLPGLYMLRKCKGLLPAQTLSLIYQSVIVPHIDYCDVIWSTCNVNHLDMIQKLQNRAAKIITGAKWYDSSSQARKVLGWDCINDRSKYHDNITMFKIMNNYTAPYLRNRFTLRSNDRYHLRGFQVLNIPKPNTNSKKRSLSYRGAVSWNALDQNLKAANTVKQFKYCFHHQ